ncbi:hypothetical protein ES708_31823 [subsurface metagenome]
MANKLARLAAAAQGLSIDQLRLLLRFAEFLASRDLTSQLL